MSGKNLLIVIALIVLGVGAYWWYTQQGGYQTTTPTITQTPVTTPTTPVSEKTIMLNEQKDSGESGEAMLKEVNGKVAVTLNLTGAPKDTAQPAHIHSGTCADIGAVKYPLTSPTAGWSETTLDVTIEKLMSEIPLAINVHKSANQTSVYVACGDLQ